MTTSIEEQKDYVYWERNQLLVLLASLYQSHLARHPEDDEWDDDWRWIVCIHLPLGQATWHIHDSEVEYFNFLEVHEDHWDGHDNDTKYARVRDTANLTNERIRELVVEFFGND